MSASKLITHGDAKVAINVNSALLFVPGGDVYDWTDRLTRKIKRQTAYWAPKHNQTGKYKRPLRPHRVTPLKRSFVASRAFVRKTKYGSQVLASVGSTAGHALYVDQGTGIYGGNGPYPAKLLPPWSEGSPSLYEHTWNPGGRKLRKPVMVKGQPGKEFFAKGVASAYRAMRIPSVALPAGTPSAEKALNIGWPLSLTGFSGSTTAEAGFLADLPKWREWRDAAWRAGEDLGKPRTRRTATVTRTRTRAQQAVIDRKQRLEANASGLPIKKQPQKSTAEKDRERRAVKEAKRQTSLGESRRQAGRYKDAINGNLRDAGLPPNARLEGHLRGGKLVGYSVIYYDAAGNEHHKTFQ